MTEVSNVLIHLWRDGFDLAPELGRLRAEEPISALTLPGGDSAWLVTRYADVRAVLGDATRFSNANPIPGMRSPDEEDDGRPSTAGFMLGYDPPEHTRLHRMLAPEFSPGRMRRLRPRIEAIIDDHLDRMEHGANPTDLVSSFALPVPSLVICELLGVPYESRAEFQSRSHLRLNVALGFAEMAKIIAESRAYLADLIDQQRKKPGDNLIGALIRDHGDDVSDDELVGMCDLLLFNGHESTANMLGIGTLLLLRHPDQLASIRDDPAVVESAVEELLRYLSVVNSTIPRTALEDVTVAGQLVKAGDKVLCSLSAANRDELLGSDLESLDVTRRSIQHVAFGHGIHHCIGAPLARMELCIAFPALLRRFPEIRLAVPFEEINFRSYSFVYGVESLPVAW